MTHQVDDTAVSRVMESLIANGLDGLAEAVGLLMNEAMKLERAGFPAGWCVQAQRGSPRARQRVQGQDGSNSAARARHADPSGP